MLRRLSRRLEKYTSPATACIPEMLAYIIRRLVYLIPVLFVLKIVVFTFAQMLPSDIIDIMMGEEDIVDPEIRAALEEEFGQNDPIYVKYGKWIGRVLQETSANR